MEIKMSDLIKVTTDKNLKQIISIRATTDGNVDLAYQTKRKDIYILDGAVVKLNSDGVLTITGIPYSDGTNEDLYYTIDNKELIVGVTKASLKEYIGEED